MTKKDRLRFAFSVSVSLILSFSTTTSVAKQDNLDVHIKGSDIFYTGKVSSEGYQLLREQSAAATVKLLRLVINSGGGPIEDGMDIANWLHDEKLDLLVIEKCMSSCANYIFPAARNKEISDSAVVAWHGSLSNPDENGDLEVSLKVLDTQFPDLPVGQREEMKEKARTGFTEYKQLQAVRQKEFFKKIAVDERVTMLGPLHGVEDFYCLSVEDMKLLGITNVKAPTGYAKTDLSWFRKKKPIEFIVLQDDFKQRLHAATSEQFQPEKNSVTFVSPSGKRVTASFDRQADSVSLTMPNGVAVRLPRAVSGSGARYANERITFWEHQGEVSVWSGEELIFKGTPAGLPQ